MCLSWIVDDFSSTIFSIKRIIREVSCKVIVMREWVRSDGCVKREGLLKEEFRKKNIMLRFGFMYCFPRRGYMEW
jgi:hypothetical protein